MLQGLKILPKGLIGALLVAQPLLLCLFIRNDPDSFHDGFVYSTAVAVADGRFPNRDVFAQYGPIAPMFQGLWLWLTTPTVLSLRIFTLILVFTISYILYLIVSKYSDRFFAACISFAWLSWFASALPWPSVLTTFFTILALYLLLPFFSLQSEVSYVRVIFGAALLVLASFTRIQLILIPLILVASMIVLPKYFTARFRRFFIVSTLFTFFSLVFFLWEMKALFPYFNQAIIWASVAYGKVSFDKAFLISFLWFPLIFFLNYLLVRILMSLQSRSRASIGITFLMLLFSLLVFLSEHNVNGKISLSNPNFALKSYANYQINSIGYVSVFFIFLLLLNSLIGIYKSQEMRYFASDVLVGVLNLVIMLQLWPLHDEVHIWFVTPIFICSIIIVSLKRRKLDKQIRISIVALCLLSIAAQTFINVSHLSRTRVSYENFAMSGMMGEESVVWPTDRTFAALSESGVFGDFRNDCSDGIFAVVNGRYALSNGEITSNFRQNYVKWFPEIPGKRKEPHFAFLCKITNRETQSLAVKNVLVWKISREYTDEDGNLLYNVLVKVK